MKLTDLLKAGFRKVRSRNWSPGSHLEFDEKGNYVINSDAGRIRKSELQHQYDDDLENGDAWEESYDTSRS